MQELRQVLYRGDFTKFLIDYTDTVGNLHRVLKLSTPDNRLKDTETLLRNIAFSFDSGIKFAGNLKNFLDDTTKHMNLEWDSIASMVKSHVEHIEVAITTLSNLLGGFEKIGRKYNRDNKCFEPRFNTVLFEVQLYFALNSEGLKDVSPESYQAELIGILSVENFSESISHTTKSISAYTLRYELFSELHERLTNEKKPITWM